MVRRGKFFLNLCFPLGRLQRGVEAGQIVPALVTALGQQAFQFVALRTRRGQGDVEFVALDLQAGEGNAQRAQLFSQIIAPSLFHGQKIR